MRERERKFPCSKPVLLSAINILTAVVYELNSYATYLWLFLV